MESFNEGLVHAMTEFSEETVTLLHLGSHEMTDIDSQIKGNLILDYYLHRKLSHHFGEYGLQATARLRPFIKIASRSATA